MEEQILTGPTYGGQLRLEKLADGSEVLYFSTQGDMARYGGRIIARYPARVPRYVDVNGTQCIEPEAP